MHDHGPLMPANLCSPEQRAHKLKMSFYTLQTVKKFIHDKVPFVLDKTCVDDKFMGYKIDVDNTVPKGVCRIVNVDGKLLATINVP